MMRPSQRRCRKNVAELFEKAACKCERPGRWAVVRDCVSAQRAVELLCRDPREGNDLAGPVLDGLEARVEAA